MTIDATYKVRVDDGRTVTISGDIEDLDSIVRILSSQDTTNAVLASAAAQISLTKDERDRWKDYGRATKQRLDSAEQEIAQLNRAIDAGAGIINHRNQEIARLRAALTEAINYLQTAPFNYANGVTSPDGMADEGTVRGMEAHNRLIKRLRKALES